MTSRPPTLTLFPYTTLFRSERERELRRHERTARAGIVTRANGAVHAAPKSRERGRAGGTQRGRDASQECGDERHADREEQHASLDDDLADTGEIRADRATNLVRRDDGESNPERPSR